MTRHLACCLASIALQKALPATVVVTCDTDDQAAARMEQKGAECAEAVIEMVNLLRKIDALR